jgi:hypothetical protein
VIVENQLDRRVGRTGGIEQFEEFDELAAAVAVPDQTLPVIRSIPANRHEILGTYGTHRAVIPPRSQTNIRSREFAIDLGNERRCDDLCEPLQRFGDTKRSPRRSYGLGGPVLIYAPMTTPSNGGTRSRLLNHADVGDNGTNFAPRKIEFRLVRCRRYGAFGKRLR